MTSKSNNKYLLVSTDAFTKFVYLKAVPDTSSEHVIHHLQEIFTIFGNPVRLISDGGKAFVSEKFGNFMAEKGVCHFVTAVGMARGNGQGERSNRTILDALSTMGADTSSDGWDENISKIQQGINTTKHRITETSPAELFFGYLPRTDGDRFTTDVQPTIDITKLRQDVSTKLENNRVKQNEIFNKKRCAPKEFKVGDLVVTKIASIPANGTSKKLLPKYKGPFKIVEALANDRFRIKENIHSTRSRVPYEAVVAMEHLKIFHIRK